MKDDKLITVHYTKELSALDDFYKLVNIKSEISLAINVLKNKCNELFSQYEISIYYGKVHLTDRDNAVFDHINNSPSRVFNNHRLVIKVKSLNNSIELEGVMYSILNPYLMMHQSKTKSQLLISNIKESDYIAFISNLNLCYSKIRDQLKKTPGFELSDSILISK